MCLNNKLEKYPDLLNVKEVAEILRVSPKVIYAMIKRNQIKTHKFGREMRCSKIWLIENYITG